jgi:hypothetical protein
MRPSRQGATLLVTALSAATFVVPATASADELRRASLEYSATDPKAACPDEHALRQRVATRLGADPFTEAGDLAFRVVLVPRGGRYAATITVDDRGGPATTRTLDDTSCPALVDSVASTIALTIDPIGRAARADTRDAPVQELPAPTATSVEVRPAERRDHAPRRPPPRPKPPGLPIAPTATLDAIAHVGLAPNPTLGARVGLGLASRRVSVHAEGSAEATAAAGGAQDEIVGQVFAAHVVPCLALAGPWIACAAVDLGVIRARARLAALPDYGVDPIVGLGGRVGLRIPMGSVVAFRAQLEGGGLAMRVSYILDGRRATTTGPVFFGLTLGLEARAP